MKLVRFISLAEYESLQEGRTLSDERNWGDQFPNTTSYGKCFLIGDSRRVQPSVAIGTIKRDRFLSYLSSRECDYDYAFEIEGDEETIMGLFTKEVGTYYQLNMEEYCIRSYSLEVFESAGLQVRFTRIPHFVSGY